MSSQKFAHPTSGYSPTNFTEGEASQAIDSTNVSGMGGRAISAAAVSNPLQSNVKVHIRSKVKEKRPRTEEVSYECLEVGGVRGKGQEPVLLSGDESSSGDEHTIMPKLPSSSGTSLSSGKEAHSGGEKSVDSKERKHSYEEDIEEEHGVRSPILMSCDPKLLNPQEPLRKKAAREEGHVAVVEVQESLIFHVQHREGNVEEVLNQMADEDPGSACLEGRHSEKKDMTPTVEAKEGGGPRSASLEKLAEICINPGGDEPSGSDCLIGRLNSGKKGKKIMGCDGREGGGSGQEKGVEQDDNDSQENAHLKKKTRLAQKVAERKKINLKVKGKDVSDVEEEREGDGLEDEEVIVEEKGTDVEDVQLENTPLKKKTRLAKSRDEKKKFKAKVKDVEVPNMEEEIEDDKVDEQEDAVGKKGADVEEMKDVEVGQTEKFTGKKGQSGGLKKRKKSMEAEKEEEGYPTSVENLYTAKATTLTALSQMAVGQVDEESVEIKTPSLPPNQPSRVMTRSQEKLQSTQVKKKKKRRGT